MSFYRIGGHSKKKRHSRKQPDWDDSVNDLTVYRASQEEVLLRKEAHKSKNHMSVKLEQMRKENQKRKLTGAEAKQLAIMKEVLYDQQQLENVLAKSDTMMAVVKDLFGDDPRRFMGFPNVTTAPSAETTTDGSTSLVAPVPDIYTRSEKLSHSVMGQSALNDVDTSDSEEDEEIDCPEPISYEPKMNLQRFQEYLQEEEKRSVQQDPPSLVSALSNREATRQADGADRSNNNSNINTDTNLDSRNVNNNSSNQAEKEMTMNMQLLATILNQTGQGQSLLAQDPQMINHLLTALVANGKDKNVHTPRNKPNGPSLPSDRTPPSAINDTKKIKKTKKIVRSPSNSSVAENTTANMNDMRKVLQQLELELIAYERQTGRQPQGASGKTETFTGYTVALVDSVSRLTRYLKETDLRVRTEVTLREQLTQDVYQLRAIIDALATDLIVTQEEYSKLYSEHQRYKESTQEEISSIKKQLQDLSSLIPGIGKQSRPVSHNSAEDLHHGQHSKDIEKQQQKFQDSINSSKKSDDYVTSSPLPSHFGSSTQSGDYQTLPSHLPSSQASASLAAVMLSPPVRKTRVATNVKSAENLSSDTDLMQATSQASEPPRLTQTPPVMNTISVPRPISLVQSNVAVSLPSASPFTGEQHSARAIQTNPVSTGDKLGKPLQENDLTELVKLGEHTELQLHQLREMAVEEALNNPAMQSLMQNQIEELNRQQEEARRRLRDLLKNQRFQQHHLQQQFGSVMSGDDSSPPNTFSGKETQKQAVNQDFISPPISPIPLPGERQVLKDTGNIPLSGFGRGITVALPMADLDVSGDSGSSPRLDGHSRGSKS